MAVGLRLENSTLFESCVLALNQCREILSKVSLILGKSLSLFHSVVQSSGLNIL